MTRRVRLAVSGLCALLAVSLCLLYGRQVREEVERERTEALERYGGEVVSLVIATKDIEAGEAVDGSNVTERDWLADLAPSDAVTSVDSVIGREASVPVAEGVPLTSLNFREVEGVVEVPPDRVAVSVPVSDDLGVSDTLSAGSNLAAYEVDEGTTLISSEVQVLSSGQEGASIVSSGTLTVAVRPEDVAPILSASGRGSLRLALPGDEALADIGDAPVAPTEVRAESETEGDAQ